MKKKNWNNDLNDDSNKNNWLVLRELEELFAIIFL